MPSPNSGPGKIEPWVFRRLPEIYASIALLVCTLLCFLTPPFLVPDEANHAKRAFELSRLELVSTKSPLGVGAMVDANLLRVMDEFAATQAAIRQQNPIGRRRPDGRVNFTQFAAMQKVGWAHQSAFSTFQNTAIYPPFLYIPQAIGWRIGNAAGMSILHTLLLARLFAAVCAIAIGWWALRLCGKGRWILFAGLLLPTELGLNASCSQDAVLLPMTALAAVMLYRAIEGRRALTSLELTLCALLLVACVGARIAYLPLALVLVLPAVESSVRGWRKLALPLLGAALVTGLVGLWQLRVHSFGAFLSPDAQPTTQVSFLRHHPLAGALYLAEGTAVAAPNMAVKGLEVLGENDAFPPATIYLLLGLGAGGIVGLTPWVDLRSGRALCLLGAVLLATAAAISLAMYVTWTPPQSHRIEGLQHRYYLPLLPFALLLVPRIWLKAMPGTRRRGQLVLAATAIYLAAVLFTPWVAAQRFYGLGLRSAAKVVMK